MRVIIDGEVFECSRREYNYLLECYCYYIDGEEFTDLDHHIEEIEDEADCL